MPRLKQDAHKREAGGLSWKTALWVAGPVIVLILLTYFGEQYNKPKSAVELAGQNHFEVRSASWAFCLIRSAAGAWGSQDCH